MQDYTAATVRLEAAYESMQIARKRVADEVRAEYRRRIREEIEDRQRSLEYEFARELAAEHARGLPGNVIRTHVLRTQDWGRWKKWRDLAEIAPERVTIRNAKEEREAAEALAKSHFRWSDDYATLTVVKNSKGEELETPITYRADTIWIKNELFYARSTSERDELNAMRTDTYKGWMTQLHNELEAQIEAGNITAPEGE